MYIIWWIEFFYAFGINIYIYLGWYDNTSLYLRFSIDLRYGTWIWDHSARKTYSHNLIWVSMCIAAMKCLSMSASWYMNACCVIYVVLHIPSFAYMVNPCRWACSAYVVYNTHANIRTGYLEINLDLHPINVIRRVLTLHCYPSICVLASKILPIGRWRLILVRVQVVFRRII